MSGRVAAIGRVIPVAISNRSGLVATGVGRRTALAITDDRLVGEFWSVLPGRSGEVWITHVSSLIGVTAVAGAKRGTIRLAPRYPAVPSVPVRSLVCYLIRSYVLRSAVPVRISRVIGLAGVGQSPARARRVRRSATSPVPST